MKCIKDLRFDASPSALPLDHLLEKRAVVWLFEYPLLPFSTMAVPHHPPPYYEAPLFTNLLPATQRH